MNGNSKTGRLEPLLRSDLFRDTTRVLAEGEGFDQPHQRGGDSFRLIPFDEMEIRIRLCLPYIRHLPPANPVCRGDDLAVRRLPEHFRGHHGGLELEPGVQLHFFFACTTALFTHVL
jgi:hypothetical protein